jgi:hypothetical protein
MERLGTAYQGFWKLVIGEERFMQQQLLYSPGRVPLLAGASVTEWKKIKVLLQLIPSILDSYASSSHPRGLTTHMHHHHSKG